jgi:hypothetical protein
MARDRAAGDHRGTGSRRELTDARSAGRADLRSTLQDRIRVAQAAARLIAEHGISDWSLAKRKAARQLMLPESTAMPSNDDVVAALTEHHALFGGAAHLASLRTQREEGLAWMRKLAAWEPLLVGGVAAGWATAHSDVRLELVADDPKAIEIALANDGIAYTAAPPKGDAERQSGGIQLRIESPRATIRLSILAPQQRRNRPRRDDEPRLSIDEVVELIATG